MRKELTCILASATMLLLICIPACAEAQPRINTGGKKIRPEPRNWYAGDIHVHRNCGNDHILEESMLPLMMEVNDLSVISLLTDIGNGEVKDTGTDLQKVTGRNSKLSSPGRIIRWDAEWHWDATYTQFSRQALGGHLVLLGLKKANQIWEESPYKILEWARKQNAVGGFAHMQYLNDSIQDELNCCIPVDYPVEAAMGTIDFVSEDVYAVGSLNNGTYNSEAALHAYYKLLNCGFRIGLAAGTDYPCNNNEPLGNLLTYVNVGGKLTYDKWINGIKKGRTVVSRNGHEEFILLQVNKGYEPGDELKLKNPDSVSVNVIWSSVQELTGHVQLVVNGKVVHSFAASADPADPFQLTVKLPVDESSWICARRMGDSGHEIHTAPVYISVAGKPVRASAADAEFFIGWIQNILTHIKPGGKWNKYFTSDYEAVEKRYRAALGVYEKILEEVNSE